MKTFKKIMHLVPLMILWLMMSAFVWSWIFTFLTDAPREEKMVLFIECDVPGNVFIASELEKYPSGSIRLVQVRPFSYSMMSSEGIRNADLYIMSESGMAEYSQWIRPLPDGAESLGEVYFIDAVPYGIKVYDGNTQSGVCSEHIAYEAKNYYLAFGNQSLHLLENDHGVDNEAIQYASYLFKINR